MRHSTAWRSLRLSRALHSPPDMGSIERSSQCLSLLTWRSYFSPHLSVWMTIHYTALCRLIMTSSTSDPGFLQAPPSLPDTEGSGHWCGKPNADIHPYFMRLSEKWKCDINSEYDSFTDAASTTGSDKWVTSRQSWHHGLTQYLPDGLAGNGRLCTANNPAANKSHIAANYLSAVYTLIARDLIMKSWLRSVRQSVTVLKKTLHHQLKGLWFILHTFSL